jgi:hypothetical protein
MDVEEELLSFLNNLPQRGRSARDGRLASKNGGAEIQFFREGETAEVILGYYGFGAADEFLSRPTRSSG